MPPLIAAIPAAIAAAAEIGVTGASVTLFGTTFTGLTAALIAGGATLALGTLTNILNAPGSKSPTPGRDPFGTNPNEPRTWLYGRGATGGSMVYWETVGHNNEDLWMAIAWHDTQADGLETSYMNNNRVAFDGSGACTISTFSLTNCSITSGSPIVTVVSTAGLFTGMGVQSSHFAGDAKIYSVDSPTQFRADHNATTTSTTETITFQPKTLFCDTSGANPRMWRYDHLGTATQLADGNLVTASATSTGLWTSACRLQGMAYSVFHFQYKQVIYPTGIPTPLMVMRGRRVWDPRQDPAYGGTGSQSRTNELTWTWSQNQALCLLDYLLGVNMNSIRIGGCGVPIAGIDISSFINGANISDQSVTRADGTTEARYTCNGWVDAIEDKKGVVQSMLTACDGFLVQNGGLLTLIVGAAQTATVTLTDDDLAGALNVYPTVPRQQKANSITSVFADPAQLYQVVSAPQLIVSAYEAADGGLRLETEIRHRFTTSLDTVQRLNTLALGNHREQLSIDALYKPKAQQISVGSTFLWTSALAGYTSQKMICLQRDLQEDGSVHIIARQETDAKYAWSTSQVQTPPTFNTNNGLDPTVVDPPLLTDISATGVNIAGSSGTTIPGLLLTAAIPPSAFVAKILTQFKLSTDTIWHDGPPITPVDPTATTFVQAVTAGTSYDVQFAYQTAMGQSPYTPILGTTSGASLVPSPNSVDTPQLVDNAATRTQTFELIDTQSPQSYINGTSTYSGTSIGIIAFDVDPITSLPTNDGSPISFDIGGFVRGIPNQTSGTQFLSLRVFRTVDPLKLGIGPGTGGEWGLSGTTYIAQFNNDVQGWNNNANTSINTNVGYLRVNSNTNTAVIGISHTAALSLAFNRMHIRFDLSETANVTSLLDPHIRVTFGSTVVLNQALGVATSGTASTYGAVDYDFDLPSAPGGSGTIKVEFYDPNTTNTRTWQSNIYELAFGTYDPTVIMLTDFRFGQPFWDRADNPHSNVVYNFNIPGHFKDDAPPTNGTNAYVGYSFWLCQVEGGAVGGASVLTTWHRGGQCFVGFVPNTVADIFCEACQIKR